MRIIGGAWRGRALTPPGKVASGDQLRPTADRVRESLFNVIEHGHHGIGLDGIHVLDLFAGTGALGLEALSRGAAHAVFVDRGRPAARLIAANVQSLRAEDRCSVLVRDVRKIGPNPGPPAAAVFLDPPYGLDLGGPALLAARQGGWIAPGGRVFWEERAPQPAPHGFTLLDTRAYGDTHVMVLSAEA